MKNSFYLKNGNFPQERWGSAVRVIVAALPLPYFFYTLSHIISCRQIMGCTWTDFASTFPFYLLLMAFVGKLNFVTYLMLYFITVVIYMVIFYEITLWLEKQYHHFKEKPKFILKRV
jgi:hypothetical protein